MELMRNAIRDGAGGLPVGTLAPPIQPAPPGSGGWIRRLWPYLAAHKKAAIIAFGVSVFGVGLIQGSTPWVERRIIDNVVVAHSEPLAPWLSVLVAFGILNFVSGYIRRYYGGRVSLDVQYDLRTAIYERLQRLDFARHDEMQTGQLVSRASSDVGLIQGLLSFMPIVLGNLVQLVVAFAFMLWFSWELTLLSLVAVPLLFWTSLRMRTSLFPATWHNQQVAAEVAGVVDENVTGVRVVKAFGQEEREVSRLSEVAARLFGSRVRTVKLQARYTPTLSAIPTLVQVAILALGGWMALHHRISLGTFLAFSSYAIQMVAPVRMFATILAVGQQARAGAERILDILDSNPLVVESPDATPLPPVEGLVEFDHVTFGYLRSNPVLDDFVLRVEPGERVAALVGASGSGKSTVSLLLPRFYDVVGGAVRIDGVDVRDVTFTSLRSQVGVVFEESFLFSDSVRANIAYGRPSATDAEIEAAARGVEAHDFIMALPDGYDTVVGERGLTLSGGQRQRVALARALLADPRVLILDDATSSVDSATEEEIHVTLREVMEGRTTLLVAHRLSTLRLATRIVVVDAGRIVESGTHEELEARSALYRSLLGGPEGVAVAAAAVDDGWARGDVTAEAWPEGGDPTATPDDLIARASIAAGAGRPGMGPRGGGAGVGRGNVIGGMALAATPQLLEAVEALPPINDEPDIDSALVAADDTAFSLGRFVVPFRRALGLGLALVALDALLTLAGPFLVARGLDNGVIDHSIGVIWIASALFLGSVLIDWVVTWAYTRYTGRTAERLLRAPGADLRPPPTPLGRLLRQGDGGPGHDPHDHGRRGLQPAAPDRSRHRHRLDLHVRWRRRRARRPRLAPGARGRGRAPATHHLHDLVPPRVVEGLQDRPRPDRRGQRQLPGEPLRRVAQASQREDRNIAEFQTVAASFLDARVRAQQLIAIFFPFVVLLSDLAEAAVLGRGSALTLRGQALPGVVIAFILYLDQFFSPIQQLSQTFDTYQEAVASGDRIDELMATPTGTPPAAVDEEVHLGDRRLAGRIDFEDVHFAYPGVAAASAEALSGVTLTIPAGQNIALVGETGAGKSTIVKLIARYYDTTAGRILIDGVPVDDFDVSEYRRQLGIVPQEPFLFAGTLRDNIAYGRPDASEADVEAAARAVGAHEVIVSLPGGYFHVVSERGRSLSAGQRQLIALARAELVDPRILLLDEATSNLDLASEAKVQQAMSALSVGRTTVLIAHRLPTARAADRIVVIDGGRVVEDGTHDDLVALDGHYASLWAAFASAHIDGAPTARSRRRGAGATGVAAGVASGGPSAAAAGGRRKRRVPR